MSIADIIRRSLEGSNATEQTDLRAAPPATTPRLTAMPTACGPTTEEEVAGTWSLEQAKQREQYDALHKQEARILKVDRSWSEKGDALRIIRDERLYAGVERTFDDYLARRWKRTKRRQAYVLIDASIVAANLRAQKVEHLLSAQAAVQLFKLGTADLQAECLREAIRGCGHSSPTADYLAAAVASKLGKPKPKAKNKKPKVKRVCLSSGAVATIAGKRITIVAKRADQDPAALLLELLDQLAQASTPASTETHCAT